MWFFSVHTINTNLSTELNWTEPFSTRPISCQWIVHSVSHAHSFIALTKIKYKGLVTHLCDIRSLYNIPNNHIHLYWFCDWPTILRKCSFPITIKYTWNVDIFHSMIWIFIFFLKRCNCKSTHSHTHKTELLTLCRNKQPQNDLHHTRVQCALFDICSIEQKITIQPNVPPVY